MGKVVGAIAVIGLTIAIAAAAPAIAGALLAATASTTAVAVVTAVASLALTAIAGVLTSLVAGKPTTSATPTTFRQSIVNARIIYGKRRAGGVIVFFHPLFAGKFHYRFFVIAVAGHRCKGVVRWLLNDEVVTVDGSGMVTSGPYANNAWLWFGRGTDASETPATFLTDTGGKWTTDHVGKGVAKIFAKFRMVDDVVQAGMPNITAEIEGKDDIRDPRTGNAGYSRNAAAVFYDWLAMPREDGGFGAYADELPDDAWLSAQCGICDEAVSLRAGGTEERYAFDSVIEVGAAPSEVRQTFVTCCAGTYSYTGGKHLMRPGYWVPVSATLHEDDLLGPISVPLLAEEGDIATEVSGTFIDPASLYQPQPVPTRSIAADDVRQGDYDLPHITSHPRGQRILEIMLRRAQAEKRVTWPMNIMGLMIGTMDTVQLATDRFGLSNYAWTVTNWGMSSDYACVTGLKEESPDIYDWSAAMELLPGEVPTLAAATPIGDQIARAIHTIISQSIAYPVTSDEDSITVEAFTGTIDDGRQIAFPAATLDGLTVGTAYMLAFDQGAGTYQAAVMPALALAGDASLVLVGYPSTLTADGTAPPSETPPPGWGGGGGACPVENAPVLMANARRDGPGETKRAGDVVAGDCVWTRHERTGAWGAYRVTAARAVDAALWRTDDAAPLTSGAHLWWLDGLGWTRADVLGERAEERAAVIAMTVEDAHTYVLVDAAGEWRLSHNKLASAAE